MFAAAAIIKDGRRGIAGRLLDRIRRRRAQVTRQKAGASSFWLIQSYETSRGIDWDEISHLAGRHRTRLVLDPAVEIPEHAPVKRFVPAEFALRLLANTANQAVAVSRIELYQRTVGLADPAGRCQKLVMELVKYYSTVKVYTNAPGRYQVFCRQMMELYGVAVLVYDSMASLKDCILVLCPDGIEPDYSLPRECPVLVTGDAAFCGGIVVSHMGCSPGEEFLRGLPPGMNPTYFSAALYELGRQRALGSLCAESCRIDGRAAPAGEIALLIRARAARLFDV